MPAAPRSYLDHNATAPLRPEAREAALGAMALAGNASAVHAEGRAARRLIEAARRSVAALAGMPAAGVVFTSGGSEGAASLLAPGLRRAGSEPVERLVVGATEHPCVLAGGRFAPEAMSVCPVDADGVLDLAALAENLARDPRPALVAAMAANNETGVVHPVREAAAIVRAAGGMLVCDAVQAAGRLPLASLDADAIILSGHKLGALQGVGAVVLAGGVDLPQPLIGGGGQEGRRRAGTENLAGIASFGAAADAVAARGGEEILRMARLRDWMEGRLATICPDAAVFGQHVSRLGNTSCIGFSGLSAETTVIACDLGGVAVSAGSACSSGKLAASHVLGAMGVPQALAGCAVRVSLGWNTTERDVERFLDVVSAHLRRRAALRAA